MSPFLINAPNHLRRAELMRDLALVGRGPTLLGPAHITALEGIINGAYDRPAAWAQNLLCMGYGHCRPPITGGGTTQRRSIPAPQPVAAVAAASVPVLSARPNPAESYTAFYFAVPEQATGTESFIVVRDVMGKEQHRFVLAGTEGQVLWDTRAVAPGTYAVEMMQSGVRLAVERVVVKP